MNFTSVLKKFKCEIFEFHDQYQDLERQKLIQNLDKLEKEFHEYFEKEVLDINYHLSLIKKIYDIIDRYTGEYPDLIDKFSNKLLSYKDQNILGETVVLCIVNNLNSKLYTEGRKSTPNIKYMDDILVIITKYLTIYNQIYPNLIHKFIP